MKITENVHQLKHDFEISLGPGRKISRFVNSLIIFGEKITLIDSGVKESFSHIISYIENNGRDASDVSTLILSHSHPDHIGSAMKLKRMSSCEILAHEAERDWMEDLELQHHQRPVPGFLHLADESVEVDGSLDQDQELTVSPDMTLRVIHAPGHSRGSLNILFIEDKILFTADTIPVKNDIPNYENYKKLVKSLRAIRDNHDFEILLSSWTPPVSDGQKIDNLLTEAEEYLENLDRNVQQFYTGRENHPLEFCSRVINQMDLPEFYINPIVDNAFRTHLS